MVCSRDSEPTDLAQSPRVMEEEVIQDCVFHENKGEGFGLGY